MIAEVDGIAFAGRFAGFHLPLEVARTDGSWVCLPPWPYRAHLAALRESVFPVPSGLMLDAEFFASRVLAHAEAPPTLLPELLPILLWWAAGGDEDGNDEDPLDLGTTRVTVRQWSEGERLAALLASVQPAGGRRCFDMAGYLDSMVRACAVSFQPVARLEELDSRATARLLGAVIDANQPGALPDSPEFARMVLALCRRLGWTPAQVLAAPAAEIDRLRTLLALVTPEAPPAADRAGGLGGLADRPGSVVIRFEDDA